MMEPHTLAKKFVSNSLRREKKDGCSICIGPCDVVEDVGEWLDKKILLSITKDCLFEIDSYTISMCIDTDNELTISGMVNGNGEYGNEKEFEIVLKKALFIEQLTNMLKYYNNTNTNFMWNIGIDDKNDVMRKTCDINSVF